MHWFKFKNKYSTSFNLLVSDLGRRQRAEEQIEEYEIPYRNEDLIIHSNRYKPYLRQMIIAIKGQNYINKVNAWLIGRGKLRTSIDEGGFFYASVMSGLDYDEIAKDVQDFRISFKVNPFFYLDSGEDEIVLEEPGVLFNPGTIYSEPLIKIIGTGDITLNVNDEFIRLKTIGPNITIDSDLMQVYRDAQNLGHKMEGNYPLFGEGENNISWEGDVSKLEIIPRWREL